MTILFYLSLIFLFFYVLLILTYWVGWLLIRRFDAGQERSGKRYSILVPARNEDDVIEKCLSDIAAQDFPASMFEVIVINDHSTDHTREKVETFIKENRQINISMLNMQEGQGDGKLKKAAITYGILKASGDYIILTDADCSRGSRWIQTIDSFVASLSPKMIYAPVMFKASNLFEKIQSMEFAGLVGIGASAIRMKNPNMCSAANLVFEKAVFAEVKGYEGNDGIASGDDEFLLHKVFKKYPDDVHFLKHHDAIVHTSANVSVKQLADQRRRWVSKSTKYENRYITAILVAAYFFNALILFDLFADPLTGLFMLGVKTLAEGLFLYSVLRFFSRTQYLVFLPVAELFHVVYVLIIGIWANVGTYNWKGRDLK